MNFVSSPPIREGDLEFPRREVKEELRGVQELNESNRGKKLMRLIEKRKSGVDGGLNGRM